MHPFSSRSSFPDFDAALKEDLNSSSSKRDQSFCSQTSSLNLSIGARAAVNENLRLISRFGLDSSVRNDSHDLSVRDPRDLLWDKLLEETSMSAGRCRHDSPDQSLQAVTDEAIQCYDQVVAAGSQNKLTATQDTDFFESPRVLLLLTPERNRAGPFGGVTSRTQRSQEDSRKSPGAQQPQQDEAWMDQSFSLSAVDVSRISTDGSDHVEPPCRSSESLLCDSRSGRRGDVDNESYSSPTRRNRNRTLSLRDPWYVRRPIGIPRRTPPRRKENVLSLSEHLTLSPIEPPDDQPLSSGERPDPLTGPRCNVLLEFNQQSGMDVSALHTSSSGNANQSTSSTSFAGEDRRRFRTVVPFRVFSTSPVEDFPEQYDSFSVPLRMNQDDRWTSAQHSW